MFFIFGSLFAIAMIVLSLMTYFISREILKEQAKNRLQDVVKEIGLTIDIAIDSSVYNYLIASAEELKKAAQTFYNQYQQGILTEEEAKDRFSDLIMHNTIGTTGYPAVVALKDYPDYIPITVHPKGAVGVDLSKYEWAQAAAEKKQGYVTYMWKNPGEEVERLKATGLAYFEPWDYQIWSTTYRSEILDLVNIADLREKINQIEILNSGYPFIIDPQGIVLIHPFLEGENYYDKTDADGKYFVREIIHGALTDGEGWISYPFINTQDNTIRDKIAFYQYYEDFDWIIVGSLYEDELYAPIIILRNWIIVVSAGLFILLLFIIYLYTRQITNLIRGIIRTLYKVFADGNVDLTNKVEVKTGDEIGELSNYINKFISELKDIILMARQSVIQLQTATDGFLDASHQMEDTSSGISALSSQIAQSNTNINSNVFGLTNEASNLSENMANFASSFEQMTVSMNEVSNNTVKSADIANKAVDQLEGTNKAVMELQQGAAEIGEVVSIINKIADQTNLLALNATIEAAGAGEAGKSFAVVANEVKELSKQTAEATREIDRKIAAIKNIAENSVSAIKNIHTIVGEVDSHTNAIAAAIEQQTATMNQIATSIDDISSSTERVNFMVENVQKAIEGVSTGIKDLSISADNTASVASETASSSKELSVLSEGLQQVINRFKIEDEAYYEYKTPKGVIPVYKE